MALAQNFFKDYVIDGGVTMYALIPLSVYTLALIVQRTLDLRKSKIVSKKIVDLSYKVNSKESYQQFKKLVSEEDSSLARIIMDYLKLHEKTPGVDPQQDLTPIDDEAEQLYQSLSPISTSYVVAPLIGVLGTTIGIMETFKQFASAGKRDMGALVTAIDQSLITTMWGLIIAVPAYFFFSVLQRKIFFFERKVLPKVTEQVLANVHTFMD